MEQWRCHPIPLLEFPTYDGNIEAPITRQWLEEETTKAFKELSSRTCPADDEEEEKKKKTGEKSDESFSNVIENTKEEGHWKNLDTIVPTLHQLDEDVSALTLAIHVSEEEPALEGGSADVEVDKCLQLARILLCHPPPSSIKSFSYRKMRDCFLEEFHQRRMKCRANLASILRRSLTQSSYPILSNDNDNANESIETLSFASSLGLENVSSSSSFAHAARALMMLDVAHSLLSSSTQQQKQRCDLLDELCRPMVRRVKYHFLTSISQQSEEDTKQETHPNSSTSLERLPVWILSYVRDDLLRANSILEFIHNHIQPLLDYAEKQCQTLLLPKTPPVTATATNSMFSRYYGHSAVFYVLREMVQLIRFILHRRNFFSSVSSVVAQIDCIEQMIQFDSFLRTILLTASSDNHHNNNNNAQHPHSNILIMPSLTLSIATSPRTSRIISRWMAWDCQRALAVLRAAAANDQEHTHHDDNAPMPLLPSITRAYTSIVSTTVAKQQTFNTTVGGAAAAPADKAFKLSRIYLASILGPLSEAYAELAHADAAILRQSLLDWRKRQPYNNTNDPNNSNNNNKNRSSPEEQKLRFNIQKWIQTITGVHIAASALTNAAANSAVSGVMEDTMDLGRSTQSLRKLSVAMIEEYTSCLVDRILTERAGLASYIMRCAHMLSTTDDNNNEEEDDEDGETIAFEGPSGLEDTLQIIQIVVQECSIHSQRLQQASILNNNRKDSDDDDDDTSYALLLGYACRSIPSNIGQRLEDMWLDIALDVQGIIPTISYRGAQWFGRDVQLLTRLFPSDNITTTTSSIPLFGRLKHVMELMMSPSKVIVSLQQALMQLIESESEYEHRIAYEKLQSDSTLLEQAQSMIHAKGWNYLSVEDVINILNRRMYI